VGFTLEGALSDAESLQPMVDAIDTLTRQLIEAIGDRPSIFVFRDHHGPDQIEPPSPPHRLESTGHELLDPRLRSLRDEPRATLYDEDGLNGVGRALVPAAPHTITMRNGEQALTSTWRNVFVEWVVANQIDQLLVVGDCTDICDLDFVVAVLSVRNHGMFGTDRATMPVQVYEPACATYHMPDPERLGLPETARHDKDITHHAALYFMQSRGAVIVDDVAL